MKSGMCKKICEKLESCALKFSDLSALFFRLVLAYGFFSPAMTKLSNPGQVAEWFGSLGYPFPLLNAYVAGATEAAGVVLLTLGFATRLITLPLMFVMVVAITTVHWSNGFQASNNGYEIPLYYLLMLFSLFISGAGKWSLDSKLCGKGCCGEQSCGTK